MLVGADPFEDTPTLSNDIRNGNFNRGNHKFQALEQNAKDLIEGLLKVDPNERYNIKDLKEHAWFL